MQNINEFKLILRSKVFSIPSDFRFFTNISPIIYKTLISEKSYEVKSKISNGIFQCFIDYWINMKIPEISSDNIIEYDIISQEFDFMKDLVQLFKNRNRFINKIKNKNHELLHEIENKRSEIEQKTINYQQIIRLLLKENKIETYCKFLKIREALFEACTSESLKQVTLLTRNTIEFENDFIFVLNDEKKTAEIFQSRTKTHSIPKSIIYQSQEYNISGILEGAFKKIDIDASIRFIEKSEIEFIEKSAFSYSTIKSISIPVKVDRIEENTFSYCEKLYRVKCHQNSKLKFIGKFAFLNSSISSLVIPSCVSELQDGWCKGTSRLIKILLMPSDEENILYYDKKFIIGKSDAKSDTFDVLLFARRDIKEAIIPPFIKKIAPYAFENCISLQKVEFIEGSQLRTIGSFAFSKTQLKSIIIPSSVFEFQFGWCYISPFFTDVKIMQTKEQNVSCYENKLIIGKSDQKSDVFDVLLFASRDIEEIVIPSFVKRIEAYAFENCTKLQKVEFDLNSNLKTIGQYAFSNTSICHFSVPSSCNKIDKYSFYQCKKLQSLEIPKVDESLLISECAFFCSTLKSLKIPSSGIEFQKRWCCMTEKLNCIKIISNGMNDISFYDNKFIIGKSDFTSKNFDVLIFACRNFIEPITTIPSFIKRIDPFAFDNTQFKNVQFENNSQMSTINESSFTKMIIESITIPSQITQIDQSSFALNKNLKNIKIENDSQLKSIKANAFYNTSITSITIPSSVTRIEKSAFLMCSNLEKVEFAKNSQLKLIDKYAFSSTRIEEIIIPSHVTCIDKYAFYNCNCLKTIKFENKSELKIIGSFSFSFTSIEKVIIPSNVLYIESNSFYLCRYLTCVEFEDNSSLKSIGCHAFYQTSIERIEIPSQNVLIDDFAFDECHELEEIEFQKDSKLNYIGFNSFATAAIKSIYIPKHVTQIKGYAFSDCENLESFECSENSELNSLDSFVFSDSPLRRISIPSSVSEFINGWCSLSSRICELNVIPTEKQNIICYNKDYILLKSDPKSSIYDVLVFARRNIENAIIPSFIKRIAPYAFCNCYLLENVIFTKNSELISIDESAFDNSSLGCITFPSHLKYVKRDSFAECEFLEEIDCSKTNELIVESYSFFNSSINKITIPSNIEIHDGAFYSTSQLTEIEIIPSDKNNVLLYNNCFLLTKLDFKSEIFDVLLCMKQDVCEATIPSFIKKIAQHAFTDCNKLKVLNFENDSELSFIDDFSFFFSKLQKICIPKKVTKIGLSSFSTCKSLHRVEFDDNSSLEKIGHHAFSETAIVNFSIPKSVISIGKFAFESCLNLQIVEIIEGSKLKTIKFGVFKNVPNMILMVPSSMNGNIVFDI